MNIPEIIFVVIYYLGSFALIFTKDFADIVLGILLILFSPCTIPFFLWLINGIISIIF